MKVIGLDGKEYAWNIVVRGKAQSANCSSLHIRARALLKNIFPYDTIYEELAIPGIRGEIVNRSLIADFYIHFPRLMIEVQGEQHYKFNDFFYGNKLEFFRSQKLDQLKRRWCDINEITLVELPYNKSDEDWENIIRNR